VALSVNNSRNRFRDPEVFLRTFTFFFLVFIYNVFIESIVSRYLKLECRVDRPLACLTGRCGRLSQQASQYLSGPVMHCTWDRLTSGAGARCACGEGQALQSRACCKCIWLVLAIFPCAEIVISNLVACGYF